MHSKAVNTLIKFLNNRLIELFGIILILSSIFLFASIATYSPNDPNFLYDPGEINIKNILGLKGSIISDFLLQSIGLISLLLAVNFFVWGFKLCKKKIIHNFISKTFFTTVYILLGTTSIFIYSNNSFWLIDNGNSGFLGRIIGESLQSFSFLDNNNYFIYILFLLLLIFFSLSIDLKFKEFIKIIKLPYLLIRKIIYISKKVTISNNENPHTNIEKQNNEIFNTSKEKVDSQPILPFKQEQEKTSVKKKFKLPPLSYLEINKNLEKDKKAETLLANKNSELLEKILSDFGIEGKIKRISCGPVVTLNEFEPAAGVRVSQIINLSNDIAR